MRSSILIVTLAAFSGLPLQAQPEVPTTQRVPAPVKAPIINAEAKSLIEAMMASYKGLKSYSDQTRAEMESDDIFPQQVLGTFPVEATLAWGQPDYFRFEGHAGKNDFLALSDGNSLHAINPQFPGLYLEQATAPMMLTTKADGTSTIVSQRSDAAIFFSGAIYLGIAFMREGNSFWGRIAPNMTVLALETDADIEGTKCRVLNVQSEDNDGGFSLVRLWVGSEDKRLRRLELTNTNRGFKYKITETHSNIRVNPELPASTWEFTPPIKYQKVATFPAQTPPTQKTRLKTGAPLPIFSGDDINDKPIELNPKDGKVTLLYFFQMSNSGTDIDALQRLHSAVGGKGLHIVGINGDGRRERVQKFVSDHKLTFPIYFDEDAVNNHLASMFGVRAWPTTLIFNRQGQLEAHGSSSTSYELLQILNKLFPGTKTDALIFEKETVQPVASPQ